MIALEELYQLSPWDIEMKDIGFNNGICNGQFATLTNVYRKICDNL